jgi:hypothetical protein
MKTKHVVTAILLLAGSLMSHLSAQETLKALVKKCETLDAVEMHIIKNRNKETKELTRSVVTITIRNNEALVNEFIAAFKKDEDSATQVTERKQNGGKIVPFMYVFEDTQYSFNYTGKGNAIINVSVRNNSPLMILNADKIQFIDGAGRTNQPAPSAPPANPDLPV